MPLILITGVSTGIGRALADRFARDGWTVVGTVRDVSRMADAQWPGDVRLEAIDFAERGSGRVLAERVLAAHGTPDVLVNNAGTLQFIPVEDESPGSVEQLYRVNVFEPVDLIRAFAPAMREAGGGTVVNVTSLGGRMTFPFFTTYNSSKHALEGYSEGLWHELQLSNIRVKVVEPGFVETAIWGKSVRSRGESPYEGSGPYGEAMASMARFEGSITNRSTPEQAAEEIRAAILDPSDRLRYPVAAYARPMLRSRRWLGELRVMRFFHKRWMGA